MLTFTNPFLSTSLFPYYCVLMIYATGVQYKLIKAALEKLDTVATQVMIEASIVEVQLTDELKYGLEWTFKGGLGSDYDGVGVLADAGSGPAAVAPV